MKNSWYVDRRTVLRGIGATLALPFLEAMVPLSAAEAAKPPIRFGIWYYQHGSLAEYWMPAGNRAHQEDAVAAASAGVCQGQDDHPVQPDQLRLPPRASWLAAAISKSAISSPAPKT